MFFFTNLNYFKGLLGAEVGGRPPAGGKRRRSAPAPATQNVRAIFNRSPTGAGTGADHRYAMGTVGAVVEQEHPANLALAIEYVVKRFYKVETETDREKLIAALSEFLDSGRRIGEVASKYGVPEAVIRAFAGKVQAHASAAGGGGGAVCSTTVEIRSGGGAVEDDNGGSEEAPATILMEATGQRSQPSRKRPKVTAEFVTDPLGGQDSSSDEAPAAVGTSAQQAVPEIITVDQLEQHWAEKLR